ARGRCRAGRGRLHDAWLLHITEVSLQRCTQGASSAEGPGIAPASPHPKAVWHACRMRTLALHSRPGEEVAPGWAWTPSRRRKRSRLGRWHRRAGEVWPK
ncbi:unnamed protein product, partial [Symbiodinium microadriaticum]